MNIIRAYGIEENQILHDIISNANRNGRLSLCYIIRYYTIIRPPADGPWE